MYMHIELDISPDLGDDFKMYSLLDDYSLTELK